MAELEIHHEHHESDPLSRTIGILAALIAMLLAIVSIASHRTHTEAVLLKTDANDKWNYYEAQRMKFHDLELGEDILNALPSTTGTQKNLARYAADKGKYDQRAKKAQAEAEQIEKDSTVIEEKALKFDFAEGLLEIAVVMMSMFFISKNKLFPVVGGIAAVIGLVLGGMGFLS
jgi:hypothetical protein